MATPYNTALDLLAARAYSVADLRRKLLRKEFSTDEVEQAIERLLSNGLLDDQKYAVAFARQKLTSGGAARRRIKQELWRKGIAGAAADAAVDSVMEDEDFDAEVAIERVARKKLASLGDLDDMVRRRRLYGFLARRGYDLNEINSVVDRLVPRSAR
jgi:regulatory protein